MHGLELLIVEVAREPLEGPIGPAGYEGVFPVRVLVVVGQGRLYYTVSSDARTWTAYDETASFKIKVREAAVTAAKANSPATGAPTISGTPQVDQTLTAGTSDIADEDGLTKVSYSYQ